MKLRIFLRLKVTSLVCLALPLLLAFAVTPTRAQTGDNAGPPAGPLLAPAPEYSKWVVTFTYPQNGAGAETRTKTITTTKTQDVVLEAMVTANGLEHDIWHVGEIQYDYLADSKIWLEPPPKTSREYDPMPANGFRDLDWIAMNNFIGRIKSPNGFYLVFSPVATRKLAAGAQLDQVKSLATYALIDDQTRLPALAQENFITRVYQFETPPVDKLTLPQDLEQILKKEQDVRARMNQPPRPF
jgi:hypothetical protein